MQLSTSQKIGFAIAATNLALLVYGEREFLAKTATNIKTKLTKNSNKK